MWTPASTVRHDDEDGLYARARRERAALAPDAYGGELGGLPAAAPATGADSARHRQRTRHHHRGPCGARRARPRHRAGGVRRGAGPHPCRGRAPRPRERRPRRGRRPRPRPALGLLRRGARAPGAPAPARSRDRAARDDPRLPAGRRGRRPRRGLRGVHLVPRQPRPRPVAGRSTPPRPVPTAASRTPAGTSSPGRTRPARPPSPPRRRPGATPTRSRAQRGAACGPTASPARRSPRS